MCVKVTEKKNSAEALGSQWDKQAARSAMASAQIDESLADGLMSGTFRWKRGKKFIQLPEFPSEGPAVSVEKGWKQYLETRDRKGVLIRLAQRDSSLLDCLSFPITVAHWLKRLQVPERCVPACGPCANNWWPVGPLVSDASVACSTLAHAQLPARMHAYLRVEYSTCTLHGRVCAVNMHPHASACLHAPAPATRTRDPHPRVGCNPEGRGTHTHGNQVFPRTRAPLAVFRHHRVADRPRNPGKRRLRALLRRRCILILLLTAAQPQISVTRQHESVHAPPGSSMRRAIPRGAPRVPRRQLFAGACVRACVREDACMHIALPFSTRTGDIRRRIWLLLKYQVLLSTIKV